MLCIRAIQVLPTPLRHPRSLIHVPNVLQLPAKTVDERTLPPANPDQRMGLINRGIPRHQVLSPGSLLIPKHLQPQLPPQRLLFRSLQPVPLQPKGDILDVNSGIRVPATRGCAVIIVQVPSVDKAKVLAHVHVVPLALYVVCLGVYPEGAHWEYSRELGGRWCDTRGWKSRQRLGAEPP